VIKSRLTIDKVVIPWLGAGLLRLSVGSQIDW